MRGGALRNLLTIQRKVQVGVTEIGEPNFVWQNWREDLFCEVEVRRGREHFENKQRYSEEVWRFRVRFDEVIGFDTSMQILHEGNVFDIKASLPDGQRHDDMVIECTLQDSFVRTLPLAINIAQMITAGKVGQGYAGFLVAPTGGRAPYSVVAGAGGLPPGLDVDPLSGNVYGTPTQAGSFPVTFTVTDADGGTASLPSITLTVNA